MTAERYRLTSPLLAIEKRQNGPSALRVLTPGTEFIVLSTVPGTGMLEIETGQQRMKVFRADVADRASLIVAASNAAGG